MSINLQLQLITYFFAGLLALLLLLILSGVFGVSTLLQRQEWIEHTNTVIEQVGVAERLYTEADYQARLRLSSGKDAEGLSENREKVFKAIEMLRASTGDNSAQTVRCDSLVTHVKQRFAAQDEQFKSRRANGLTIEFDKALVAQNNEFAKTIEVLFANLQLHEFNLLRLERMPRLYGWQWVLVYFTAALMVLILVVTTVWYYLIRRVLKRNQYVGQKIDETLHNGSTTDAKKLVKELERFRGLILETDELLADAN